MRRRDEDSPVWEYPASAVQTSEDSEGIGYASIRFRAFVQPNQWPELRTCPRSTSPTGSRYGNGR